MSVPVSTIPGVKGYVFDQLVARAELIGDTILVCYDEPGPYQPDDIVSVGDVARTVEPVGMVGSGGQGWLGEKYRLDVTVDCFRGGDDARTVFERACALADVVVDAVRLDPSLGGRVIESYPSTGSYQSDWLTHEETGAHMGRSARVVVSIYASAHI